MVGPTRAVTGLVSRSLDALFSIADYTGVVSEERLAKAAPETSRPARSTEFDAASASGAASELPPDDGHGHEWTLESPSEQTATAAQPASNDDTVSNMSASGYSGGWSAGSAAPIASHRSAPASSAGSGGSLGGGAASPAGSGRSLPESMPESAITIDELEDVGLPREMARGRSPESWLVDYGIQPDGDADSPLLPEKIGKELIDSAPTLIGGLSPLLPAAPLTTATAPARNGGPSADQTAPDGAAVQESPATAGAPLLTPAPVVAPAAVRPDGPGGGTTAPPLAGGAPAADAVSPVGGGAGGGDAASPIGGGAGGGDAVSPVGGGAPGGDSVVPGSSSAPIKSFTPLDVTAPDGGDGQVIAIVPEPVSLLLFGTSAVGWVVFTRLRSRRRIHKG